MKTLRVDDTSTTGHGVEDVGRGGNSVAEGAPDGGHLRRRRRRRRLGRIRLGEAAATAHGKIGAAVVNGGEVKADNVLVDPPLHPGQRLYEILLQEREDMKGGIGFGLGRSRMPRIGDRRPRNQSTLCEGNR